MELIAATHIDVDSSVHQKYPQKEVAATTFDLYTSEDGFMGTYDQVVAYEEELTQDPSKSLSESISAPGDAVLPLKMFKDELLDNTAATDTKQNSPREMLSASQMEVKALQKTIEELKTANVSTSQIEQKKIADLEALNASLFETIASLNTSLQTLQTSIEGLTEPISPTVWASEPVTFELNLNSPLGADLGNLTLVVAVIQPDSQAARSGIKPGWKVIRVGEKSVKSIKEFTEEIQNVRSRNTSTIQITFLKPDFGASLKQRK
jgi:hypothetical protein